MQSAGSTGSTAAGSGIQAARDLKASAAAGSGIQAARDLKANETASLLEKAKANNWVNLQTSQAQDTSKLLFNIANKETLVPSILSLPLVLKSLIANGAEVNATDFEGVTPLHYASNKGHLEMAQLLIANEANVNAKDKYGDTPLHYASNKDISQLLLEHGAKVNAKDRFRNTPLHRAVKLGI